MSAPPPSTQSSPRDAANTSFHQFLLFPGEIQNLIWDQAALHSPAGIHFLLTLPSSPFSSSSLSTCPSSSSSRQSRQSRQFSPQYYSDPDGELALFPSRHSASLNLVHLSLACRAARAGVLRYRDAIEHKTFFRSAGERWTMMNHPRMNLTLDLRRDLVCFGTGSGNGLDGDDPGRTMLECTEGQHIVFTAARKFGLVYRKGWEDPGPGPFMHGRGCVNGWREELSMEEEGNGEGGGQKSGFCSVCAARVVERFRRLEEVWIIVYDDEADNDDNDNDDDEADDDGDIKVMENKRGWNGTSVSLKGRRFEGYELSYVSVVGNMEKKNVVVREASEVLERIKANLMDPRFCHMPWVRKLQMGILIARRS